MQFKWQNLAFAILLTFGILRTTYSVNPLYCEGNFERISTPGLLPIPKDPVSSLKDNHWTLLPRREELLTPEIKQDLEKGYNRVFAEVGKDPYSVRLHIEGLKSYQPTSEIHLVKGLSPTTTRAIDQWAQDCLNLTKAATGEDLEIANIVLGRGHRIGNDDGSLIHADTSGTYLHGLVTLEGPTTFAFPASPELANHRLLSIDKNGTMTVQKVKLRDQDPEPAFTITSGGHTQNGETILFGGMDYKNGQPGRKAIQHASPPKADLNRLTLFISIQPKKKN